MKDDNNSNSLKKYIIFYVKKSSYPRIFSTLLTTTMYVNEKTTKKWKKICKLTLFMSSVETYCNSFLHKYMLEKNHEMYLHS